MSVSEPFDRSGFTTPIWQALLTGLAFVAVGLVGFHHPRPRDVPVDLTGPAPAVATLRGALGGAQPGAYDLRVAPTRAQGLRRLRDGSAYAVVDLRAGELLYAGANGPAVTGPLTGAVPAIAAHAVGARLRPVDALPLRRDDTSGLPLFYLTFGVVLASYLFSVTATAMRTRLTAPGHWASAALCAAGLGLGASLIARLATNTLDWGSVPAAAGLLALASLGTSSATWLALRSSALLGGVIASLVLLILGSASGGVVPGEFQPGWLAALRHVLPMGTALQGIRDVVYFGGGGAVLAAAVLTAWAVVPVAIGTVLERRAATRAP